MAETAETNDNIDLPAPREVTVHRTSTEALPVQVLASTDQDGLYGLVATDYTAEVQVQAGDKPGVNVEALLAICHDQLGQTPVDGFTEAFEAQALIHRALAKLQKRARRISREGSANVAQ